MKIKIFFKESEHGTRRLLGRSAEEYLVREFAGYECVRTDASGDAEICAEEGGFALVLPLDMPLVTVDDVADAAESMKKHDLGELLLGSGDTGARMVRCGGGRRGYSLTSPHFVKVDSAKNLSLVYNQMKERILSRLLLSGVYVFDTENTVIDDTAVIEPGAEILPFCRIEGGTTVMSGVRVEGAYLADCTVERGAHIVMSHLVGTRVGAGSEVGPFARLRGADVGEGCRVGDFVEVKNSALGKGVKSAHLAYIGDADVGARTNIGCGTVFCNYDGKLKHRATVGEDCFIGANVNLVAPVAVGEGAFVAAGTTVTEDVQSGAFVIGRSRQQVRQRRCGGEKSS